MSMSSGNTRCPAVLQEGGLAVSAPPLTPWTNAPSRPAARLDSNSTGTSQVATLREFSRDNARSAA